MTDARVDDAVLTVPGSEPVRAQIRLRYRPVRERALRGLGALLGFWILMPAVFFIPPHIPWVLTAFVLGLYFGLRQWRGTYVVESFQGACPHCGEALELEAGSKIRLPLSMTCWSCHRDAMLRAEAGAGGEAA